ncbi:hypothetical protein [Streptomyces sp. NPDC007100]|uniref:hypothetical protein n=1 Tax=Streptomyces sp. NPDC007100 TaxID=3155602 RepID=UPI0033E8121B
METEEERYSRSPERAEQERQAVQRRCTEMARREWARHREAQEQAQEERRSRVKRVGTLKQIRAGVWETRGWQIDGVDDHEDAVTHRGNLGGLSIQDLCALAHGPRCRCTRGRS